MALIKYVLIIQTLILAISSYTKILFKIKTVFIILSYITSGKGYIRFIAMIIRKRGFLLYTYTGIYLYSTFNLKHFKTFIYNKRN